MSSLKGDWFGNVISEPPGYQATLMMNGQTDVICLATHERLLGEMFLAHSKADIYVANMARASIQGSTGSTWLVCPNEKPVLAHIGGLFRPGELVITGVLRETLWAGVP